MLDLRRLNHPKIAPSFTRHFGNDFIELHVKPDVQVYDPDVLLVSLGAKTGFAGPGLSYCSTQRSVLAVEEAPHVHPSRW